MDVRGETNQSRQLVTLQQLLALPAADVTDTLNQAAHLIAEALHADKVDTFIYQADEDALVALGTSATPMGRLQHEVGLQRLRIAEGGRTVEAYLSGTYYLNGQVQDDPGVHEGIKTVLGVRSMILVPLEVEGERRGVLSAASAQQEAFTEDDLQFLGAAARWVGMVMARAELVQQVAQDATERGRLAAADEIIATLAHDLGNYLTPLKGRIALIRRRAVREERERDVADADEAVHSLNRVQRLINDLLNASRLDRGVFALNPRPIDLAALVRETAAMMQTDEALIEVRAPDEVMAAVDAERIREALSNLLSNAARYSPPGIPIEVVVSADGEGDGASASIAVCDRGPGIPPEMLHRLFRRFAPGPDSPGMGLGLYLARGIAQAHGGTLTVDTAPGAGSTFTMRLPLGGSAHGGPSVQ